MTLTEASPAAQLTCLQVQESMSGHACCRQEGLLNAQREFPTLVGGVRARQVPRQGSFQAPTPNSLLHICSSHPGLLSDSCCTNLLLLQQRQALRDEKSYPR